MSNLLNKFADKLQGKHEEGEDQQRQQQHGGQGQGQGQGQRQQGGMRGSNMNQYDNDSNDFSSGRNTGMNQQSEGYGRTMQSTSLGTEGQQDFGRQQQNLRGQQSQGSGQSRSFKSDMPESYEEGEGDWGPSDSHEGGILGSGRQTRSQAQSSGQRGQGQEGHQRYQFEEQW